MAIDHYAPCPCGSGKKLKFCKCVDNLQDLEKITRLMEGGQEVAALDRINQQLKKTPNAAWLLALKADLAVGMQDDQLFIETANRFHKLKPDNPLALIMQSLACLMNGGKVEQACPYLLEGLAESRESIPGMAVYAVRSLLSRLIMDRRRNMAGFWEDFLEEIAPSPEFLLQVAPLNFALRSISNRIQDVPAGAPWKERMNEVQVLSRSLRIEQAEKKLLAILRDYPDEVIPLQRLLQAQYAKLDQYGAAATAKKLSSLPALSDEERALYYAIWLELDTDTARLSVPFVLRYAEIELNQEKLEKLEAADSLQNVEDSLDQLVQALLQDEVRPQRSYLIFDDSKSLTADTGEEVKSRIQSGFVVVYGKETDRPARALLFSYDYPAAIERFQQVVDLMDLGAELEVASKALYDLGVLHYSNFLGRLQLLQDMQRISIGLRGQRLVEEFLAIKFKDLDGQSLLEASGDSQKRPLVQGLLADLEGCHNLLFSESDMQAIYDRLGIERPVRQLAGTEEQPQLRNLWDLVYIRVADASPSVLSALIASARNFKLDRLMYQAGTRAQSIRESLDPLPALTATMALLEIESDLAKLIELTEVAESLIVELDRSPGDIIIARFRYLVENGEDAAASAMLMENIKKYPNDPSLIAFVQMMMQMQAERRGSRYGGEAPVRAPSSSGLVLPGESAAAPAGESKLWLPGS